MSTNIVLDDEEIAEAMKYAKGPSKRAVVREALTTFMVVKAEEQRLATYRERLTGIRRKLADSVPRAPVAELIRADRDRSR